MNHLLSALERVTEIDNCHSKQGKECCENVLGHLCTASDFEIPDSEPTRFPILKDLSIEDNVAASGVNSGVNEPADSMILDDLE